MPSQILVLKYQLVITLFKVAFCNLFVVCCPAGHVAAKVQSGWNETGF